MDSRRTEDESMSSYDAPDPVAGIRDEDLPNGELETGGAGGRRPAGLRPWQQVLLVLAVGVLGFTALFAFRAAPTELEPPRQIPTVTTVAAEIGSGAIRVRGSGTVRPSAEVTVAPQVGGRVTWVSSAFVSGGRFAAGQALLRVDPADYENSVEAASAEVAQRRVDVLTAEEEVVIARDEYERLARREGLDPDPENASALVLREPQLRAAQAALQSAEARLEDARLALERTWIRAPFDGIVRDETVDLGQFVSPGQAIGSMYSTGEVEIVIPLSDDEAALIDRLWETRAGQEGTRIPVEIRSEYGGIEYAWTGYVDRAEAALDEQTRTVDVVVRVPRPFEPTEVQPDRPPLLIGSYATADIEGSSFDRYAIVPAAAVRDGGVVWTVRSDTLLVMQPVELIQEVEDRAFVMGPISAGTQIIVSALPFVTDGMTVQMAQPLETAPGATPPARELGGATDEEAGPGGTEESGEPGEGVGR
ncbi:MAG: efflux RND transporter periplasmic adaptor subunit [Gemmatimonadetes bacterium]|nr:efflux RND transporter periplasmic adaptor subunit [Gemmatimonadota bacterium]